MKTQTTQINSQTITFHQSTGSGAPVFLVHGNSASGLAFERQLNSPLGEKYHLVAIDLPGHGQSARAEHPQSAYTLPGYAAVLVELAKQLGSENAVFVGWSLGGHIVLEAAPQLPQAAGFMIFGTPPLAFPPAMSEAFLPHPAMAAGFTAELSESEMDAYVGAFFKPNTLEIPPGFQRDIRLSDGRARAGLAASIAPGGYLDEVEIVQKLQKPLAIVQGEEEQLVSLPYLQSLSIPKLWRGAVQVIKDAGHAPQWEQSESFNSLLAAFIVDARPSSTSG